VLPVGAPAGEWELSAELEYAEPDDGAGSVGGFDIHAVRRRQRKSVRRIAGMIQEEIKKSGYPMAAAQDLF
jgi:hypothetical protein